MGCRPVSSALNIHMGLHIGQKVKLASTGEVGVVVWTWTDSYGEQDTYVAFLGNDFPTEVPENKPYVLRYAASSLIPI